MANSAKVLRAYAATTKKSQKQYDKKIKQLSDALNKALANNFANHQAAKAEAQEVLTNTLKAALAIYEQKIEPARQEWDNAVEAAFIQLNESLKQANEFKASIEARITDLKQNEKLNAPQLDECELILDFAREQHKDSTTRANALYTDKGMAARATFDHFCSAVKADVYDCASEVAQRKHQENLLLVEARFTGQKEAIRSRYADEIAQVENDFRTARVHRLMIWKLFQSFAQVTERALKASG
ncbi:MAG: hypothetical protein QG625_2232 [Cyanobacteriota bacterium erpe_2018_sw_39hr_WHONDRS-SW48-000098_B_bin.30]|jgi:hypothetical protein|nr:hypothetical protein [Candidatus Obscuribacter sp.]MBK9621506.1 hypothetical protein [Candidatus Obscuribacter sp.]MDQ5966077.1 hypothetical protein [Cyanobacteriota bacterium erpe_2018_sw_39hr_WHONDRS-SW48-000098_B_bin.30]